MDRNLIFTHLIIIFLIAGSNLKIFSQETGVFTKSFTADDGNDVVVHFFVPENYNEEKEYPLVIGLPPGSTSGVFFRDMVYFKVKEKDIILACPDETYRDREIIGHTIKYCQNEYTIDEANIILSGYSAGGGSAFAWGYDKADIIRGIIGIAPAVGGMDYSYVHNRPFAFICGDKDGFIHSTRTLNDSINAHKGSSMLIEKPDVGHTGDYFMWSEFRDDWWQCYEFIQNFEPQPQVRLIAPKNSSLSIQQPVKLIWNKFDNHTEYELEVFSYSQKLFNETVSDTSFTLEAQEGNRKLSWQVRPVTESSDFMWSQKWSFTTNVTKIENKVELDFPADGAEKQAIVAQLCWKVESQAEFYHLQLSEDEFQTFTIDNDSLPAKQGYMRYQHHEYYEEGTKYWWRVRAGNNQGWGPWSDARTFTTMVYNSVSDVKQHNDLLMIYPNPANEFINIYMTHDIGQSFDIRIFNSSGNVVLKEDNISRKIDISSLPTGYYSILLTSGKNVFRSEFLINK